MKGGRESGIDKNNCGEKEYLLPAHLFDGVVDPKLPLLHFVKPGETSKNLKYCMSNSFAFGGCNVSLIVENGLA
jgi:3-oxoacyl-[acyl-carrier-protein] synthase-1